MRRRIVRPRQTRPQVTPGGLRITRVRVGADHTLPGFAPVIRPTVDTGTQALVVAALAWLAR